MDFGMLLTLVRVVIAVRVAKLVRWIELGVCPYQCHWDRIFGRGKGFDLIVFDLDCFEYFDLNPWLFAEIELIGDLAWVSAKAVEGFVRVRFVGALVGIVVGLRKAPFVVK
jgi:hypothetical protein